MATRQRLKDIIFQAQRDAGGEFIVKVFDQVPQDQLWLVDVQGYLLAMLTFPDWTQTEMIAETLAEAVEFVNRKKRTNVVQFWVNELPIDDFKAVLQYLEEPEVQVPEEQTYEDDENGIT